MLINQGEKTELLFWPIGQGKVMILSKGRACTCVGIGDVVIPYIF